MFEKRNSQNPPSTEGATANRPQVGTDRGADRPRADGPPSISLPKGGGAIRGIGEKFAANPVTGTGSITVPLQISPGRSGFGPQLSLAYDSGGGNGPFGFGWSLSLPAITRKTDKGLPQYWDANESDVFILSGAEDMVPVLQSDGTRFQDDTSAPGYTIHRYRPRSEGLFALIERWTNQTTNEIHWRSISRDNITTIYGRTLESRIADSDDPKRVFTWLICESYDDKGNAILYRYVAENDENVDRSQANERNRERSANRYLKRIQYGNRVSRLIDADLTAAEWLFEVVFDYDESHYEVLVPDAVGPEAGQRQLVQAAASTGKPWAVRPDPFSSYRAGFEVRTYRRCRRVLMFHRFDELGDEPYLVRSTEFEYADLDYSESTSIETELAHRGSTRFASFITAVIQSGFVRDDSREMSERNGVKYVPYVKRSLPPLEFDYSKAAIQNEIRELDPDSLENLPAGLDGATHQWVDLEGEGVTGILTEQAYAWFYKPNLGNGRFGPLKLVAPKPSLANLRSGKQQLLDLAGNGQLDLVAFAGPTPGFYERTPNEDWESFKTFSSLPNLRWDDPNMRFVDLNGDGHADILITENEVLTWYPSLAEKGFDSARYVRKPFDEERGPRLVLADGTQSIYLADMCGDGLTDLVRIRNGEVCYWSNQGYGRFGAKVTMDNSPWFDNPDQFNQQRIRVADIDGSGTNDIVYIGRDGVRLYFNQSGNRWSEPRYLDFPQGDNLSSVMTADLFGNGTACLIWSSPLPGLARRPMRYIDLMGGQKPHLLRSIKNNLGAETRIQHAASTKFYLEDRAAGRPWVTKLPFPVHVVEQIETFDYISQTKFVSTYRYRHGYFDGNEREFRGFGYVEQRDTESFSKYSGRGLFTDEPRVEGEEFHLPPVVTKTWFHNGAWIDQDRISTQYASEYFQGDGRAVCLPDTTLPPLATLREQREACRVLKGSILRQEIYAEDSSASADIPYSISERNYAIVQSQPLGENRHAVFFTHPLETIDYHYERNTSDPRIGHTLSLKVDQFGNVLEAATVGYPRRSPAHPEQSHTLITFTDSRFINRPNDRPDDPYWRRIGVPSETLTFEITGVAPTAEVFTLAEMRSAIRHALEIAYEAAPSSGVIQKRLIERVRFLFWQDDLTGALPLGQIESLALPFESYKQAFTPGLITEVFGDRVDEALLREEGKYVQFEDAWWIPAGQTLFETQHENSDRNPFYLAIAFKDPFGNVSRTGYDSYSLLVTETTDALGNQTKAEHDYRVLQAAQVTDANDNRSAVGFDELGMVVATAVMGKLNGGEGDTLDDPTTTLEYDLLNWMNHGRPNLVRTRAREQHGPSNPRWQESYSYSNGSGREVLKKVQAEPGLAPQRDSSGTLERDSSNKIICSDTSPNIRWVGTGRTVVNNKGNPIKKYEPFFDSSPGFNDERELVEWGVTPILRYDPLGRLIRTDHPNGTFSKVEFDPWQQLTFDENDTVLESEWYAARLTFPANDPERKAATAAAAHANTPAAVHLDTLGRTFLTIADNGAAGKYETRVELDIEGNQRSVTDARRRKILTQDFDMLGTVVHSSSVDAGERWMLNNAAVKQMRRWDSRDHTIRTSYDELQRPSHLLVIEGSNAGVLVERSVYGEAHPDAASLNLRGKLFQHYDGAGVVTNERYDFKGNLLSGNRRLAVEYKQQVDWSPLATLTDADAIAATPEELLEAETFTTSTEYDALNRPTRLTTPDKSQISPTYNEANLLERVDAKLRGADDSTPFVNGVSYDAKGQRTQIDYGNGATTNYEYDEETFRLTNLRTTRASDDAKLQDLSYTYDPVGNITAIRDDAQQTVYFKNEVVTASAEYEYDAIYRLTNATGREHLGQTGGQVNAPRQPDHDDSFWTNLPHPGDGQAMGNYTERYEYDEVGNILKMIHAAASGSWTREYQYEETSNRLLLTSNPSGSLTDKYDHDAHGNMIRMPHLPLMEWDFRDQLHASSRQVVNDGGTPETTWYVYDASGQRVRKVTERQAAAGETSTRKAERVYVGSFEIYREYENDGVAVNLERETLHVMGDKGRVALIETDTVGNDSSGAQLIRYQFGNHLGSISLELDDRSSLISYEEYFPYGSASFKSASGQVEAPSKRYRYTSKERDEETGFSYHGARYYAMWLGRWVSADPARMVDHENLYLFVRDNPVRLIDSSGRCSTDPAKKKPIKYKSEGLETERSFKTLVKERSGKILESEKQTGAGKGSRRVDFLDPTGGKKGYETKSLVTSRFLEEGGAINEKKLAKKIEKTVKQVEETSIAMTKSGKAVFQTPEGKTKKIVVMIDVKGASPEKVKEIRALAQKQSADMSKKAGARPKVSIGVVDINKETQRKLKSLESLPGKQAIKTTESIAAKTTFKLAQKTAKVIPVIGILAGLYSMQDELRAGNYGNAAMDAIGFVPVVGDLLDAIRLGAALYESTNLGPSQRTVFADGSWMDDSSGKLHLSSHFQP